MVVIVDDHEDTAWLYHEALNRLGFQTSYALSAEEGWRAILESRACAVVVDFRMPQVNGLVFLKQLRADRRTRELPVVCVTGDAFAAIKPSELHVWADEVLLKPCRPEEIAACIWRAIRRLSN